MTERDRRARTRRWRRRWRKVKRTRTSTRLLLGGLVASFVFAAFVVWSTNQPNSSAANAPASPAQMTEEPVRHSVLVVGDSWTRGSPDLNTGPTWPDLMDLPPGWTVYTDAIGGTGYLGDHPGSDLRAAGRFDDLLQEYDPDVVLVALGRNDIQHDPDEVAAVAKPELEAMQERWPEAEIVVFSPFSPGPPDPATVVLTSRLHTMADSLRLSFVDVTDAIDSPARQIEDGHPNDAGQQVIAERVNAELVRLGALD